MSWTIGETVNTVQISKECARGLFEAQSYEGEIWDEPKDVTDGRGHISFNYDHAEGMDCFSCGNSSDELVAVLKKHKVKGDICFGSLEGDNAGSFWGYRFDGQGGMTELTGQIVYGEKREPLKGKLFVITGTLASMTRREAESKINDLGGCWTDSVGKKTDYLVVGDKPGSKLEKARKLGVEILNESEFLNLLNRVYHQLEHEG